MLSSLFGRADYAEKPLGQRRLSGEADIHMVEATITLSMYLQGSIPFLE